MSELVRYPECIDDRGYDAIILAEANYGGLPIAYWPTINADGQSPDLMTLARGTGYPATWVNSPTLNDQPGPLYRDEHGWPEMSGTSVATTEVPRTLGLSEVETWECWFHCTAQVARHGVMSFRRSGVNGTVALLFNSNFNASGDSIGVIAYIWRRPDASHSGFSTINLSSIWSDGRSHHLVIVGGKTEGTRRAVYLDGVAWVNSIVSAASAFVPYAYTTGVVFEIGRANTVSGLTSGTVAMPAGSHIGRVAIYDYELTADRVIAHYLAGRPPSAPEDDPPIEP